jgi:hypothetical protein
VAISLLGTIEKERRERPKREIALKVETINFSCLVVQRK